MAEKVVSEEVAASVAVEAMSEKAGASSWGTTCVGLCPESGADTDPGIVGYIAMEPSFLKKCWSPWKFLVSICSLSSNPLRTGWWLGRFTGEAVVTERTSLSVSSVDMCVKMSLSGSSVLLLSTVLSLGPGITKKTKTMLHIFSNLLES